MVDPLLPRHESFRVHTKRNRDTALVQPSGELDLASVTTLREELGRAANRGARSIVLDLSGLDFMDGAGIGAILASQRSARLNGESFRFAGATGQVAWLLELCGLSSA
jgi:anti-sigma B factor antagonist